MGDSKRKAEPSVFDQKDPHPEEAVQPDPGQKELQKQLDKGLKDTFPASDPPAASQGTTLGTDKQDRAKE